MNVDADLDELRYLEPARAEIAGDDCTDMTVKDPSGRDLGRLAGFVVNPPARRVRYFVVKPPAEAAPVTLIPISAARVNMDERAIEVIDDAELEHGQPFSPSMYPAFSDDDLLAALFRHTHANH